MNRMEKGGLTVAQLRPHVMSSEQALFDAIVERAAREEDRRREAEDRAAKQTSLR